LCACLSEGENALDSFTKSAHNGYYDTTTCAPGGNLGAHLSLEECAAKCLEHGTECFGFERYEPGGCYIFTCKTGWTQNDACKYYERNTATVALRKTDWVVNSGDPGAWARCSAVYTNVRPGSMNCIPNQSGYYKETSFWGGTVECPDGGVGWKGVFITFEHGGTSPDDTGYCMPWDSSFAAVNIMGCTVDKMACSKAFAGHINGQSETAGMLMMKRFNCNSAGVCAVYKAGRCFDIGAVSQWKFSSIWTPFLLTDNGDGNLLEQNHKFATIVSNQLKADDTAQTDVDSMICNTQDAELGVAALKNY